MLPTIPTDALFPRASGKDASPFPPSPPPVVCEGIAARSMDWLRLSKDT